LYVGVGCALENTLLAAVTHGYRAQVALLPDPVNPALAARIDLSPGAATPAALFDAIPRRHTSRGPYDPARPVSAQTLAQLAALVSDIPQVRVRWYAQAAERATFGELIVQATKAIIADRQEERCHGAWARTEHPLSHAEAWHPAPGAHACAGSLTGANATRGQILKFAFVESV
jgi:hypothetical protein